MALKKHPLCKANDSNATVIKDLVAEVREIWERRAEEVKQGNEALAKKGSAAAAPSASDGGALAGGTGGTTSSASISAVNVTRRATSVTDILNKTKKNSSSSSTSMLSQISSSAAAAPTTSSSTARSNKPTAAEAARKRAQEREKKRKAPSAPPSASTSPNNNDESGAKKAKKSSKVRFNSVPDIRVFEVEISEEEEAELKDKLAKNNISMKERLKLEKSSERAALAKTKQTQERELSDKSALHEAELKDMLSALSDHKFVPPDRLPPSTVAPPVVVKSPSYEAYKREIASNPSTEAKFTHLESARLRPLGEAEAEAQLQQIATCQTQSIRWAEEVAAAVMAATAAAPASSSPQTAPAASPPAPLQAFAQTPHFAQPPPSSSFPPYSQQQPISHAAGLVQSSNPVFAQGRPSPPIPADPAMGATSATAVPAFLHGSDPSALKVLQENPGLMASYRDESGNYNEAGLKALVATLSGTKSSIVSSTTVPTFATLDPGASLMVSNLHVSGYGPGTTREQIIQLFSQYVAVTNVVMKDNFCFVNTNDPDGVARARAALANFVLNGTPMRINDAIKKGGDGGADQNRTTELSEQVKAGQEPLPKLPDGSINYSAIFDEKRNPCSKNLWIGGYQRRPTEDEVRAAFAPHCTIVSTVIKDMYAFVNTADIEGAVKARHTLMGDVFCGGVLKVNFAKVRLLGAYACECVNA